MNILITGIHGFVGSNLVSALKSSHSIYGLDIVSSEKDGIIKTYSWNELGDLPEVDTIIHLAGKAHDTKNKSQAQVYFDINTGLTQKIFDYFLQSSAKQFIFFSSIKAAADRAVETGHAPSLTEDVIPHPIGPYGESKIKAEQYIQAVVHRSPFTRKMFTFFAPA
jgi:nucleoside-diphosphate-sugar epimerase